MPLVFRTLLLLALFVSARAQLPAAHLNSIFPPGAQIGVATDVVAQGADLDDAKTLRFSHPGITATLKSDNRFVVRVDKSVPIGTYDVVAIGRFGASNPRAFTIGDQPELISAGTNKSFAAAQEVTVGAAVNGKAIANTPEFFKFKGTKGERIIIECAAKRIDSKIDPALMIFDSVGRELDRSRIGGLIDFTAPSDGEFVVKIYDVQFRGGDDFWYRLDFRRGPWIDFVFPPTVERRAKSTITLYGRNLPGGKSCDFKIDGKSLDALEVEIQAPAEPQPSYTNRRPADAAVEGFEYRLAAATGISNPTFLSFSSAKPILESSNHVVIPPCEIQGQFFPRGNVDVCQFDAVKGEVFAIEVFSQRVGLNTDPFAVVQRVTKTEKGEEQISDIQEMYDNDQNAGGQEFNTSTRDPSWRFEPKESGTYRIKIRDLFSETISDPRRVYRLAIRKESPDFALISYSPAPPPQNKDSKEVAGSGIFLRRGDSIPIRILVLRRDNYGGPIEVAVNGLPAGVSAAPLTIPAGANNGWLILTANETAPAYVGALQIVGKAKINEKEIVRHSRAGAITWNISDYNNEAVTSSLNHELVLAVSDAEMAPLAIAAASEKPIEAIVDSKVAIPVKIARRGDFNGSLKFKAMLEPPKEFEADGKATNITFELDLKQMKLPPGLYTFAVYATSPGKYRRVTQDEAKTIESEIKSLKESLAAIAETAKKDAANARIKNLEARLLTKDVTATVWASFALSVAPAPQKTP